MGVGGTPLYIAPETYRSGVVDPKNDVWALGLMLYQLEVGHLPREIANCRKLPELERKVKSFSIASDRDYKNMVAGTIVHRLLGGMLKNGHEDRMSAADALALAYGLVTDFHTDAVGKLPDCFFGKEPKEEKPSDVEESHDITPTPVDVKEDDMAADEEESHESLDDVDFFTIHSAMSNIATNFMFNAEIVNPETGVVVASNAKLNDLRRYGFKAPLQQGFIILEVNDKAFTTLTAFDIDMLKNGMLGSSLTFKFSKK